MRALPKIIDLDKHGNMVTKLVSAEDFINMETVKQKNIFNIIQDATGCNFELKAVKTKILLQCCPKHCLFLTCPNITKFCVLCQAPRPILVNSAENKVTTCQNVSTKNVIYQNTVWIPLEHHRR